MSWHDKKLSLCVQVAERLFKVKIYLQNKLPFVWRRKAVSLFRTPLENFQLFGALQAYD